MENEKVKEIKKALKYNIKLGLSYEDEKKPCKVWLAEILTLINELESEKERLNKLFTYDKTVFDRCNNFINDIKTQARKKMAREILQIIDLIDKKYQNIAKEELHSGMIAKAFTVIATQIKIEIAKQYGVDINKVLKDKTED